MSVCPAGADCQWLDTLRMRQIASNASLHRSQSNPILGSPFFRYFNDQDSYAAAVRRTQGPVKYQQITPINQSRSSSPTQYGLTKSLSGLGLNSRDSGFSSLNTDSSAERGRYSDPSRRKCDRGGGSLGSSPRGRFGGQSRHAAPPRGRGAGRGHRASAPAPGSGSGSYAGPDAGRSPHARRLPRPIPGMPVQPEPRPRAGEEESRGGEGGWTRVEHRKKPPRASPARGGRERARGSHPGRRTF